MELQRQTALVDSFRNWAQKGFYTTLKDNRRRYRMQMADAQERADRNLSCLPSTKSTAVVDQFVENALQAYHQDVDSISFTAKSVNDPRKDELCRWLTEIFKYRAKRTAKFFPWHRKQLKAMAADGIGAAFVSWKREIKTKDIPGFAFVDPSGAQQPVDQQTFTVGKGLTPELFIETSYQNNIVVKDTFWFHLLDPLTEIAWDVKAPLLDVNMGQFLNIKLQLTVEDCRNYQRQGWFDLVDKTNFDEKIIGHQEAGSDLFSSTYQDTDKVYGTTDDIDLQEANYIDIWMFFFRENNDWKIQFSAKGETELSSPRSVNEVFFAGREVNRLPVVIGYFDDELWENIGRGLPKLIAPLEDEYQDHKNNLNDFAKQALNGKYWVDESANTDIDQLINYPVVRGRYGQDFGEIPTNSRTLDVLRTTDSINSDINGLIPTNVMQMGRSVAPKGMNQTLGAMQMVDQESNSKMGVQLQTYNETFMEPLLYLVGQLVMAYESDETVARIAAGKVTIQPPAMAPGQQPTPFQPPVVPTGSGFQIDFSALDFGFDVNINAGLGQLPNRQKFQNIMQMAELAKMWGVNFDTNKAFKQVSVLAGYTEDQFINPNPQPPPQPEKEFTLNVSATLQELMMLEPRLPAFLTQKLLMDQVNVKVKADTNPLKALQQNGGGMVVPNRTGQMVDATGPAGAGMSQGGMNGPR